MNDTYCEICEGPADMYTTEVGGDNYEDRGATNSSHCKRKKLEKPSCIFQLVTALTCQDSSRGFLLLAFDSPPMPTVCGKLRWQLADHQ